ncbi:MAG: DUF4411 family protein [Betaproteobacteria bacterium AqS2]|uniref:DUF4411 family protein n=1 Tax=Candidatus Amphirhobacter heronislandensis TaxID=1732024 RepID=A0A930XXW0_9GAMM|nr:DUF4411 family protein [Betaproteobacteria bacterium AqS2]
MLLIIEDEGYLVDSCTLLNWKSRITGTDPKDARFRKWIRAAFQIGLLNISRVIAKEIRRNSPALSKVLSKWGVKPIDSDSDSTLSDEAEAMLKQFEAEGRITSKECVGANDLEIVLVAEFYGLAVVTDEAHGKDRCNMPTVCRERGVPCVRSADLLAKHDF